MAKPNRPIRSKRTPTHEMEVRRTEQGPELLVDGVPMRHGVLPDGLYFLYDYAFDPAPDLEELGRKYLAYQDRVAAVRSERREG